VPLGPIACRAVFRGAIATDAVSLMFYRTMPTLAAATLTTLISLVPAMAALAAAQ
jgi:hypothetical protein